MLLKELLHWEHSMRQISGKASSDNASSFPRRSSTHSLNCFTTSNPGKSVLEVSGASKKRKSTIRTYSLHLFVLGSQKMIQLSFNLQPRSNTRTTQDILRTLEHNNAIISAHFKTSNKCCLLSWTEYKMWIWIEQQDFFLYQQIKANFGGFKSPNGSSSPCIFSLAAYESIFT